MAGKIPSCRSARRWRPPSDYRTSPATPAEVENHAVEFDEGLGTITTGPAHSFPPIWGHFAVRRLQRNNHL